LANIEQTPGPQGSKGDTGARGPAGSAGETVVVETSSNSASECAFATSTALAETQLEVAGAPMGTNRRDKLVVKDTFHRAG